MESVHDISGGVLTRDNTSIRVYLSGDGRGFKRFAATRKRDTSGRRQKGFIFGFSFPN